MKYLLIHSPGRKKRPFASQPGTYCKLFCNDPHHPDSILNRPVTKEYRIGDTVFRGFPNLYPIAGCHNMILKFDGEGYPHLPQAMDVETGKEFAGLAEQMPEDTVLYFNSKGAYASIPEHLHFQSIDLKPPVFHLLGRLPKTKPLQVVEQWPFGIIATASSEHFSRLAGLLNERNHPFNALAMDGWFVVVPRVVPPGPLRYGIKPGALEMAGVKILEDATAVSDEEFIRITAQTAIPHSDAHKLCEIVAPESG